ncbi:protein kinase domain-containing protein (plasmid) [Anabaena sp. FACHB-709]|uniref:protein kinase family protein n=1 Tax=Nostocaceae TaxID=1162 RepID=UPI00000CEF3E|nr:MULTISPECIES: protein kinase family protein [Nostocaceae]BAB78316.1 ser/thr protein kinase [Nostoc sp. PCC 7120 = FACHB-418]
MILGIPRFLNGGGCQNYFDIFEVDDGGTKWHPVREKRIMKVLKWNTPKLVELIESESLTLQLIQHPKIPRSTLDDYFTFVPSNSLLTLHCLIMDKFEGQNLEEWIESKGKISQSLGMDWLKQLVQILDTVHRSDFFHRDIKPSNIILQPNGQLALIDFGTARRVTDTYLAKVSGSGGTDTGRGGRHEITSIVSPRYTPLEQINGQAVPQSDFYALGRTFVRLVTGTSLMCLPTNPKTGNLIWRNKAPQIDKPLADFLDELMSSLPGQRPQTTRIILQRLERLPLQSKINRVVTSKAFQISATTLVFIGCLGLFNLSRPAIAEYLLNQGKNAQRENRLDDAENNFRQAIALEPDMAKLVSEFYVQQADRRSIPLEEAKKYYELAIKYNSQSDVAHNNLGLVCQRLQDSQCVENSYAVLFKLKPNSWEAHYGLGNFYDDLGKYNLAQEQYKLAILNNKLALDAVSNLARIKNLQREYDAAIEIAKGGLTKAKEPALRAALYKSIGWAKLEQKKYIEAKNNLEKAKELDFKRTDTYCLLAQTQEALKEINDARMLWEVCLISESNLPEVQRWRIQILNRLLGDIKVE